ncbi:MAG: TatD family deoxyribonuclease [Bacteroidales bacterium]|nr:MAG: TatD family deoxyribonuclease [Bacteroidales bacterium]
MIFVDSHSHIFDKDFDLDRAKVIENAAALGVKYHILPNIDSTYSDRVLETSKTFEGICFPLIGLHPTSVSSSYEEELAHVEHMLQTTKYYGIGEIGIDLYWDKTYFEQQKIAFRYQLKLAKALNLPVVIHSRNSFDEIFEIVDQENDSTLRGVFHAFTGTIEQYQHIVDYGGFKIGIGGIVTYKNSGLDKVVANMDISQILLETDSPYLTPVPKRGQRNESQYLIYVAHKIFEVLGIPIEEVARITTKNTLELFNIKA